MSRIYDPQYPRALWYHDQVSESRGRALKRIGLCTVVILAEALVLAAIFR